MIGWRSLTFTMLFRNEHAAHAIPFDTVVMKKIAFAVIAALVSSIALAQTPPPAETTDEAIAAAVKLMDSGKVDESIAKLKQVLAAEPANVTARFELGLAYSAKGDAANCRDTMEPVAAIPNRLQASALGSIATCLDQLGEPQKAIDTYKRALALEPDDAQLNFNLAVTLAQNGKYAEARKVGKHGAEKNPWHASAHYLLGKVFEAENFTVPALFSYLRFLALEPVGQRGGEVAAKVQELMWRGVQKTDKGANVTIDPDAPKGEGDFGPMSMMLTMSAAASLTEKSANKSEFEKARTMLVDDVQMFIEGDEKDPANYTINVHRPFFAAMKKANVLDAYAGVALSTLHLPGMDEWVKKNEKQIEAYLDWIRPQRRPPSLQLPSKAQ